MNIVINKVKTVLLAFFIWLALACLLSRDGHALFNLFIFVISIGIDFLLLYPDREKKIIGGAIAAVLFTIIHFHFALECYCAFAFLMFTRYIFMHIKTSPKTTPMAPISMDSWSDYNHFILPFEKYQYIAGERICISRGIIGKHNDYLELSNFVISEKRGILQAMLRLTDIEFVSRFGTPMDASPIYVLHNIPIRSAQNLINMIPVSAAFH